LFLSIKTKMITFKKLLLDKWCGVSTKNSDKIK